MQNDKISVAYKLPSNQKAAGTQFTARGQYRDLDCWQRLDEFEEVASAILKQHAHFMSISRGLLLQHQVELLFTATGFTAADEMKESATFDRLRIR